MQKLLCVFAHPDDETFGPGGALAVWASQGVEIEVLCLTCGDAAGDPLQREHEVQVATRLLGVKKLSCKHYADGRLCNNDLPALERDISAHIIASQPDTVLTFDRNGVSGHLDHMAVASATTQAYRKTKIAQQLLYYVVPRDVSDQYDDYFVYFPPGRQLEEVDLVVDFSAHWEQLKQAMRAHASQVDDCDKIIALAEQRAKENWFVRL